MQNDILTHRQKELFPLLKRFKKNYYLAGGTAIALHIGHRRSIDFDLFTHLPINKKKIISEIEKLHMKIVPLYVDIDQRHYTINEVKCTFLYYPYPIEYTETFKDVISIPSLLDLAAMKTLALGRRSKWKDYVDLYFILKEFYTLGEIVERARYYFPEEINEKLFRNQLVFHKDIDYSEEVDYLIDHPPTQKEIKDFLIEVATRPF
jgi:hypothetical protein